MLEGCTAYGLAAPKTELLRALGADVCLRFETVILQNIDPIAGKRWRRHLTFATLADVITAENACMRPMPLTRHLAHEIPLDAG